MSTQKKNWQPLSQEQKNQLSIWQFSDDPKDRLTTDYYNLQRQLALEDYYTMVKDANKQGDWALMEEAREAYLHCLETLRKDFMGDLKLVIQFNLANLNIWHTFPLDMEV